MSAPESTSVENLERYMGGKYLVAGRGEAWREIKAALISLPPKLDNYNVPAVSEPLLYWFTSGEAEIRDRDVNGPWSTTRVRKGSFFYTTAGAPYDCCWETLTPEPLECMIVLIGLPLIRRAFEEIYGIDAVHAHPQDASGFEDPVLDSLLERLRGELMRRRKASPIFVQGIAQAIAIHLVRNYAVLTQKPHSESPSLPGFKLQRITDWMAGNLAEEFDLARLAAIAGLSKFHFHRLFKSAMGVTPSQYHINLRMDMARRLLRETKRNVVDVSLEVGYSNPSHFARIFRRDTGLSPSDYRRQR